MSVFAQYLVLCRENPLNSAHQRTAFTGQVGVNFFFERSFEQVPRPYADTQCDDTIPGFAGSVLQDRIAGVQPAPFEEEPAQRGTRTFRGDHDDIDIFRRDDAGAFGVGSAEAV